MRNPGRQAMLHLAVRLAGSLSSVKLGHPVQRGKRRRRTSAELTVAQRGLCCAVILTKLIESQSVCLVPGFALSPGPAYGGGEFLSPDGDITHAMHSGVRTNKKQT